MKHLTALWDADLLKIEGKFCSSCHRFYTREAVACYQCKDELSTVERVNSIEERLLHVENLLNVEGVGMEDA